MSGYSFFMLGAAITVGTAVGLVVRLIQLIVEALRGNHFSRSLGWRAVLAWSLGFGLAAFAAAAFMSIGLLVLPVAIIVCGIAAWRCRALPEGAVGASFGTGIVVLVIGLMNPDHPEPCAHSGVLRSGEHAHVSCGGLSLTSWLPLALALLVVASVGQMVRARVSCTEGVARSERLARWSEEWPN